MPSDGCCDPAEQACSHSRGDRRDRSLTRFRPRHGWCPAALAIGEIMPVHPEAQQLLAALDAAGLPPFEHMTVPQAREAAKGFIDLQGEPEVIATEDRAIPGP